MRENRLAGGHQPFQPPLAHFTSSRWENQSKGHLIYKSGPNTYIHNTSIHTVTAPNMGLGLRPPQNVTPVSHREIDWSRIKVSINLIPCTVSNFDRFKICKTMYANCLRFWRTKFPRHLPGLRSWPMKNAQWSKT